VTGKVFEIDGGEPGTPLDLPVDPL
jgi:hypothetical protein